MQKREYVDGIVIDADEGKYLVVANNPHSENFIGRPKRIVLDKTGVIPEFEEREVIE
jgi:CMP-N-acetylneuraminic acid synthetase